MSARGYSSADDTNDIVLGSISTGDGYSVYDLLQGFKEVNGENFAYSDSAIAIERRGLFGECNDGAKVKFMSDIEALECGILPETMS